MKRDEAFPGKWAKAADLGGRDRDGIIEKVTRELVGSGDKQEMKTVCYFVGGVIKPMVVNSTKWDAIEFITGSDDSDNWIGQKIMLSPGKTPFQGKLVDCITVKPAPKGKTKPAPQPEPDLDDEDPGAGLDHDE